MKPLSGYLPCVLPQGIDLISDRLPDEVTILVFRHLFDQSELGAQIFETVKVHLMVRGMAMK